MVQVDVFWSYALGAGYAVAASRQLKNMPESRTLPQGERACRGAFINRYFAFSLFYAAVFFAPSGIYLLWRFTSWETMHVWDRGISPLLVVAFAITNVTQSILGFWLAWRCIRKGQGIPFLPAFCGRLFLHVFHTRSRLGRHGISAVFLIHARGVRSMVSVEHHRVVFLRRGRDALRHGCVSHSPAALLFGRMAKARGSSWTRPSTHRERAWGD